jgi:hypothetical protein
LVLEGMVSVVVGREYRIRLLREHAEIAAECWPQTIVGTRVVARMAVPAEAGMAIRVDTDDALLLGEIEACWREGEGFVAAIRLHEKLSGISSLAALFDRDAAAEPGWPALTVG